MARRSLLVWGALAVLLSPARSSSAADALTGGKAATDATARNKALVRRWIEEGFNGRSLAVVDEIIADRFAVNGQVAGREGLKQSVSRHLAAFPDLHVLIDDLVAEGSLLRQLGATVSPPAEGAPR